MSDSYINSDTWDLSSLTSEEASSTFSLSMDDEADQCIRDNSSQYQGYATTSPDEDSYSQSSMEYASDNSTGESKMRASLQQIEDDECKELSSDTYNIPCSQTLLRSDPAFVTQIAPAQQNTPIPLSQDLHAEELSFPTIYCGQPRKLHPKLKLTYTDLAKSELLRSVLTPYLSGIRNINTLITI